MPVVTSDARRGRWGIVLLGAVAILVVLVASAVGYWQYAIWDPPKDPPRLEMPEPNGYTVALQALSEMGQVKRPPIPRRWPHGTRAQLQAQINCVRPFLDRVRAAYHLSWKSTELMAVNDVSGTMSSYAQLREAARDFNAEARLSEMAGDYGRAFDSSLDAMEFGAKSCRGGGLISRLVGVALHAMGLFQIDHDMLHLPRDATIRGLERVRRIRAAWPSAAETLENERVSTLMLQTSAFHEMAQQPFSKHIQSLMGMKTNQSWRDTLFLALTPRRISLSELDRANRLAVNEARKPFWQRRQIEAPIDIWNRVFGTMIWQDTDGKWERPQIQLALLEVALAVRMHYLEHGRDPARQTDISRRWLPSVPQDTWDQPIAYHLRDNRPLIYSLGSDGKNDGGRPVAAAPLTPAVSGDLPFDRLAASRWHF